MQSIQNTQDIRSLVKNYTVVPGLVLAAIGGYAVFMGVFSIAWNKWFYWALFGSIQDSWIANLGAFGSLILPYCLFLIVVYAVVLRYYKRRFGQAKPRAEETHRLTTELIGALVAYFVGQSFDIRLHSAVSITMLVFALFLLVHWWLFARGQMHYPVLAAIAVLLSFVPLFNKAVYHWLYITEKSPDWYSFNIAICAGLLLFIAGLLDHWHMVQMFSRVRSQLLTSASDTSQSSDTQAEMKEL